MNPNKQTKNDKLCMIPTINKLYMKRKTKIK